MTGNRVRIAPLTRKDVAACIEDFVAIARDVPGEYWQAKHFLLELPRKWELSLAAWDGPRPIGYAIASEKGPALAHLHHFMLAADRRGAGSGAELMIALKRRCRSAGCSSLSLKVALENSRGHMFYARFGFRIVAQERGYHVLSCSLSERA